MVPDRQKVWTDGQTEGRTDGMDGQTDGRRQNYIPPTSSADNKSSDIFRQMVASSNPTTAFCFLSSLFFKKAKGIS